MKLSPAVAIFAAVLSVTPALAKGTVGSSVSASEAIREVARSQAEIDEALAVVHSRADLTRHLAHTPSSPINRLPAADREEFVDSLVFTRYGLASYSYLPLQKLSVGNAYRVLSLFGRQRELALIPGMRATNRAEESMLLVSSIGGGEHHVEQPLPNAVCIVDGSTNSTWCEFEQGSNCNAKCK